MVAGAKVIVIVRILAVKGLETKIIALLYCFSNNSQPLSDYFRSPLLQLELQTRKCYHLASWKNQMFSLLEVLEEAR